MSAYCVRLTASARMSAPTSSITLKPDALREGQRHAMAGRSMPGSLRRRSIETAISAPVFPQETDGRGLAGADGVDRRPHRRALSVAHDGAGLGVHRDDARRPAHERPSVELALGDERRQRAGVAVDDEGEVVVVRRRLRQARDHDARPLVAAHRVDRDHGPAPRRRRWPPCRRPDRSRPIPPRSGRVLVEVDLVRHGHDLAVGIVTARAADMMRALELAAVGAFVPGGGGSGCHARGGCCGATSTPCSAGLP